MSNSRLVTWPAPEGMDPSRGFDLKVNGEPVFVWPARVREAIDMPPDAIWTHKQGCAADAAAFAIFDFVADAEVEITPDRSFVLASVHPASAGITPEIDGGVIRFKMDRPRPLTVMLDGSDDRPLHLFADRPEELTPDLLDPSVIFFGPGVHEIDGIELTSGQTLWIAGGALLRAKVPDGAKWERAEKIGLQVCDSGPIISINDAENVRIRGRGIIDGEMVPHPARQTIAVNRSSNVSIEGITVRDSPNWNVTLHDSDGVRVEGVKLISGRLNSDGINSVNARNIAIRRCFIRNHDDSIAVKTTSSEGEASNIVAEQCVIWNDWGYALGVTYETRAPIHDIVFRDCDVIFVRHWAMGIHVVDSSTVSNVRFEDIRVEDLALPAKRFGHEAEFIRVAVASDMWGTDDARGHIRDISFHNISLSGSLRAKSEILGFDAEHGVDRVALDGVEFLGRPARTPDDMAMTVNEFARDVGVR